MIMHSVMKPTLTLLITTFALSTSVAHAEVPRKIIGRGLEDRRTGEKIRLTCAGPFDAQKNEWDCSKLRFIYEVYGQPDQFVGPALAIDVNAPLKQQLKDALKQNHLRADFQTKFPLTYIFYVPQEANQYVGGWAFTLGLSRIIAISFSIGKTAITTTGQLVGPVAFLLPPLIDLLTLPFRKSAWGITDLDQAVTITALKDRTLEAWQLRPKKISDRNFHVMLERLQQVQANYGTGQVELQLGAGNKDAVASVNTHPESDSVKSIEIAQPKTEAEDDADDSIERAIEATEPAA